MLNTPLDPRKSRFQIACLRSLQGRMQHLIHQRMGGEATGKFQCNTLGMPQADAKGLEATQYREASSATRRCRTAHLCAMGPISRSSATVSDPISTSEWPETTSSGPPVTISAPWPSGL